MKIVDIFRHKNPVISFEVFPPKPDLPLDTILNTLDDLKNISPDFISVTYGAGGGTRIRTTEVSSSIKNTYNIEVLSHLTCVASTTDNIDSILQSLKEQNIENIMALRGDIPKDISDFNFCDQRFKHAQDLITYINSTTVNFCIAAACYPEGHIEADNKKTDIQNLKLKVDSGVDFLVTQLFFDNKIFLSFLENARSIGINCPISAGIMPVFNTKLIKKITLMCGATLPKKLIRLINKYENNPEDLSKAGVDYAIAQLHDLIGHGADGIHLLTMNKADQTKEIMKSLRSNN